MPPTRRVGLTAILGVVLLASCSSAKHATQDTTSTSTAAPTSTSAADTTTTVLVPSTQGSATTLPTPTTTGSGVRIVSLTGPPAPVPCNAPSQVQLHWETQHAASVTLRINGGPVFARYSGAQGNELEPLACNGRPQTYELTAHATNGETAVKTLTLAERKTT